MVMQYFAFISECCYLMHDKQLLIKVKWMIRCLYLLWAIIRTPTWQNYFNNGIYIILTINPSSWLMYTCTDIVRFCDRCQLPFLHIYT